MSERLRKAGQASRRAMESAREQSGDMLDKAREKSAGITEAASEKGREIMSRGKDGGKRVVEHVEEYPLRYIAAGVAVGFVAGLLVPKFRNEDKLLDDAGRMFSDTVQKIADATVDALSPKE